MEKDKLANEPKGSGSVKSETIKDKTQKDIEKYTQSWDKKNDERDRKVEKEIDKLGKERERSERDKDQKEKEGKIIDWKDVYVAQRSRLKELFGEIEKEFQILWEENQELRRKFDEVTNRPGGGTFSVLQRKKREPEWELLTHFVGHRDGLWEVSTSKWDRYSFATASADRTARVWSSNGGSPVYIYVGHKGSVNSARFHPSNRFVLTSSGDSSAHVWRIPKPEEKDKKDKQQGETNSVNRVKSWAPILETANQNIIPVVEKIQAADLRLSSSPDNIPPPPPPPVEIFDAQASKVKGFGIVTIAKATVEVKHKGVVIAADWIANGERFVTASWDNSVKVWAVESGKILHDLETGHDASFYIQNVTSHHKEPLFLTSSSDYRFRLWDIRSTQPVVSTVLAHSEAVTSACFVPQDDNLVVSGSDDKTVKVWDKRNMKVPKTSIRTSDGVNRFSVSPISSNLILPLDDVRTKIYDLYGKQLGRLKSEEKYGHKLMLTSAAWSVDESVIFTAGFDRTVIAWALRQSSNKQQMRESFN